MRIAREDGSAPRALRGLWPADRTLSPEAVLRWRPGGQQLAIGLWDESQAPSVQLASVGTVRVKLLRPIALPSASSVDWRP